MVFIPQVEFHRLGKGHWSCFGGSSWSDSILRHFMLVFPLICHPSVVSSFISNLKNYIGPTLRCVAHFCAQYNTTTIKNIQKDQHHTFSLYPTSVAILWSSPGPSVRRFLPRSLQLLENQSILSSFVFDCYLITMSDWSGPSYMTNFSSNVLLSKGLVFSDFTELSLSMTSFTLLFWALEKFKPPWLKNMQYKE